MGKDTISEVVRERELRRIKRREQKTQKSYNKERKQKPRKQRRTKLKEKDWVSCSNLRVSTNQASSLVS